jgi:bis(5'-nucleosyl)-tetraphosphatase (symmetrical)
MATYAIGDLQGCRAPFEALLEKIDFDPARDRLLLAGDLINRGADSLGTLRLVHRYRDSLDTVLGNHDLHLLAVALGHTQPRNKDTIEPILNAPDGPDLVGWLRQQPLLLDLPEFDAVVTHAGLPPMWSLKKARRLAREAEAVIAHDSDFFTAMYGNEPSLWDDDLMGYERIRLIINYLTRMRFIDAEGRLDMKTKTGPADAPAELMPWFRHPERRTADKRVFFGHWAALEGEAPVPNVEALDTGCVWGGCLTAHRLEDDARFRVNCG